MTPTHRHHPLGKRAEITDELLGILEHDTDSCFECAIDVVMRTTGCILFFAGVPLDARKKFYDDLELYVGRAEFRDHTMAPETDEVH